MSHKSTFAVRQFQTENYCWNQTLLPKGFLQFVNVAPRQTGEKKRDAYTNEQIKIIRTKENSDALSCLQRHIYGYFEVKKCELAMEESMFKQKWTMKNNMLVDLSKLSRRPFHARI